MGFLKLCKPNAFTSIPNSLKKCYNFKQIRSQIFMRMFKSICGEFAMSLRKKLNEN